MAYKIDENKCIGCHSCMGACPAMAIVDASNGKCMIDKKKCMGETTCTIICPMNTITADA
ncbi:MAG: 4Fe-4S binding protein [Alphaproteobacteria bacterium]|nr:4Fe-4S binding protein [Alphaproteobacteria bacterium]